MTLAVAHSGPRPHHRDRGRRPNAWNGSTLSVESLPSSSEGTIDAVGSVGLLAPGRRRRWRRAAASIWSLGAWFTPAEGPAGRIAFRALATGSVSQPRADVTLTSRNLAWQGLTNVSADVSARVDGGAVEIASAHIGLLGGTAAGRGRVAFAAVAPGAEVAGAAVDFRGVDLETLLATLGAKPPVRVSARLDGRSTASWTAWTADGLSADLAVTTRSAPADTPCIPAGRYDRHARRPVTAPSTSV